MTADMQIPTDLTPEQLAAVAHLLPTGPCTIRPERGRSHYGTVEFRPRCTPLQPQDKTVDLGDIAYTEV